MIGAIQKVLETA